VADAINRLPWPLVWLDVVPGESSRWSSLVSKLADRHLAVDTHLRGHNAELVFTTCFEDYEAALSSQHRYNLRRNRKRLRALGEVRVRFLAEFQPDDVDEQLRRVFDIEHRSWKRQAGGSILATPGMSDFFLRQAHTLAEWGSLRLAMLECNGQPIAFELGYSAKGVYHSSKISYDQAYRKYGPGQLLRSELIRWLHSQPGQSRVDFHAEVGPSSASWSNGSYPISRVVVAPRRSASSAIFAAYRGLVSMLRHLRVAPTA
jgi:CelD/BcsL family acetyltransferase involved in cellulose biosynthesis